MKVKVIKVAGKKGEINDAFISLPDVEFSSTGRTEREALRNLQKKMVNHYHKVDNALVEISACLRKLNK